MDASAFGLAAVVAVATAALAAAWIVLARHFQVHDLPGQRRLHSNPTPRGGGIAIALAFTVGLFFIAGDPNELGRARGLAIGTFLLASAGLVDDLCNPGALLKLFMQIAACFGLSCVLLIGATRNPALAFVAAFAGVALVNAWNFMDGSNGMAGLQTLLVALALATWPGQASEPACAALLLAAACLGFLPFNFPKARVFLGDAGSHVLGGAVFALLGWCLRLGTLGWVSAFLLCTPMLLDSGLTLARRILRGRPFWKAHREHLYQYAVRKGHSHASVALAYAGATMLAWLLALAGRNQPMSVAVCLLVLAWLGGAVLYFGLRSRWLDRSIRNGSQG